MGGLIPEEVTGAAESKRAEAPPLPDDGDADCVGPVKAKHF